MRLLWFNLQYGGGDVVPTTTGLPTDPAVDPATGAPAAGLRDRHDRRPGGGPATAGAASIATISTFDPDGDNEENDADVESWLAPTANPNTSWATVCYSSQYMGAKRGVGLVVSFDTATQQALAVDVINAPYQLRFFASDAPCRRPTSTPGDRSWARRRSTPSRAPSPRRFRPSLRSHMLVLLNEIGRTTRCTEENPYRGRLGEITLVG